MASISTFVISPRRISILSILGFPELIASAQPISSYCSRCEPINLPRSVRPARVPKPVVQTVGAALPKFYFVGLESITTPVRRQRNWLVAEAFGHLRHARIEHTLSIDHLALTRRPCAQLASNRTRMKISLRLFTRGPFYFSVDTNLPVKLDPVKTQRGVRIRLKLFPFRA